MKIVADDTIDQEILTAIAHVEATVPYAAKGKSCAVATADAIKEKCVDVVSHFSASGSLNQLDLKARAISSLDVATIKMVLEQAGSVHRLHELIGPIAINVDTWAGSELKGLIRADKDGYVHGLCLILLWVSQTDKAIAEPLVSMATDLEFKFQKLGSGLGLLLNCMWGVSDLGSLGRSGIAV